MDLKHEVNTEKTNENTIEEWYGFHIFIIIIFGLNIVILNTIYGLALLHDNIDCISDNAFELTSGINKYLTDNVIARYMLIVISSLFLDIIMIYMDFIRLCIPNLEEC
jgi:hypothetical protein